MYKEILISVSIIVFVFLGDFLTQNYTKKIVGELSYELEELKKFLIEKDNDKAIEQVTKIEDDVEKVHENLAYYMEHDEIEKVETTFTSCKSFVYSETYDLAISELEKTIFVLNHLTDKYSFNLENIF